MNLDNLILCLVAFSMVLGAMAVEGAWWTIIPYVYVLILIFKIKKQPTKDTR